MERGADPGNKVTQEDNKLRLSWNEKFLLLLLPTYFTCPFFFVPSFKQLKCFCLLLTYYVLDDVTSNKMKS